MTKSKGILKRWTPDEDNFIRLNYITQTASEMSFVINRPAGSIYNRMRRLGIVIPDDIREERIARTNTNLELGRDMRFKKGMPSHNKGKKMSAELKEKMKHTFFKPGQRPANTQYDGSVRQRILNGKPYLFIRISIGNWLHLHVKLWTDANGPVPTGFNVVFKDGNTLNCVNDNLELISDAELMKRNTIQRYPPELVQTMQTLGKLKHKIYEKQSERFTKPLV